MSKNDENFITFCDQLRTYVEEHGLFPPKHTNLLSRVKYVRKKNNSAPVSISEISITDFGCLFYTSAALYNLTKDDKDKVCSTLNLQYIDNPEQANRIHTATEEDIKKLFDKEKPKIIE